MIPRQRIHHLYEVDTGEYRGAIFASPEKVAAMIGTEERAAPPQPDLQELKDHALSTARGIALDVRRQIATSASPERALSWVLKAVYGAVWQVDEAAANPLLAALTATAQAGFQLEADITGEDPVVLRDRSLEKAGLFFQAQQLVEGMERLAEDRIPTATNLAELDTITTQLRALETQARTTIETLNTGASI
jgi:hypothetical protein